MTLGDEVGLNSIHFAVQTKLPVILVVDKPDATSVTRSLKEAKVHHDVKVLKRNVVEFLIDPKHKRSKLTFILTQPRNEDGLRSFLTYV